MVAAITRFGQQLAADPSAAASSDFQFSTEGATRQLSPFLANEAYHIAIEALRNAFQAVAKDKEFVEDFRKITGEDADVVTPEEIEQIFERSEETLGAGGVEK